MSDYTNNNESDNNKLEDILNSIRGIIENQNSSSSNQLDSVAGEDKVADEAVLELTDIADFTGKNTSADSPDTLTSSDVQEKAEIEFKRFAESIANVGIKEDQTDCLDDRVNKIMRPLIKDWLDNNLPRIVEKAVSDEIKRLVPKT